MTRHLILTRHAKSDWDDPTLDDHDRPLNARGIASAAAMGRWISGQHHVPREALLSTAQRVVETWEEMRPALAGCHGEYHQQLYHAAPTTVLSVLAGAKAPCVMVIGHNPGLALLAESLVAHAPDHPRFHDFPTCATLILSFDIDDWAGVRPGAGTVLSFAVPREVMGEA